MEVSKYTFRAGYSVNTIKAIFCSLTFVLFAFSANAQEVRPTLVSAAPVENGAVEPVKEYVGTVQYYAISKLAAERAGKVDSVVADEGAAVKKGTVLLTLNRDILNYSIEASDARLDQQKHVLDKAKRDFERIQALYADNATPLQRLQDAETDYFVQSRLYKVYTAELNVLREENKRSQVTAPFDGVILKRYVNQGEWVSVGATVCELASGRLEVAVNIPQAVAGFVKTGSDVTVSVEGKKYIGRTRVLIPQGNIASRTFPVKIDLDYDKLLLGGMDAAVFLPAGDKQPALMIPRDAVVRRDGRDAVFAISEGRASLVHVDVIGYSGSKAGVMSDKLKAGDLVMTRGNETIRQGQSVSVSQAGVPSAAGVSR